MATWAIVLRCAVEAPTADEALRQVMAQVNPLSGLSFNASWEPTSDGEPPAPGAEDVPDSEHIPGWKPLRASCPAPLKAREIAPASH